PPPGLAPAVLDDDEPVSLADLRPEDSLVFLLFWGLSVVVFLQFFTRYVLNDSLAWTEEIARYLLIAVTFAGAVIGVRKRDHIAVELLARYLPRRANRIVDLAIDAASAATFFFFALLTARLALRTKQMMVSIDVPKSVVYWLVCLAFVAMGCLALRWFWRRLRNRTADAPSRSAVG
ncbi:MAG: TRAP transporter small permease, partial [Tistlia sp.]|uniref:TRAP transporter small permease n=1 Tax=Tistlia sp. TaxID=3057121 RepID=UPI0034A53453